MNIPGNFLDEDTNYLNNRGMTGLLRNDQMDFTLNYPEEFEGEVAAAPQVVMVRPPKLVKINSLSQRLKRKEP